MSVIRLSHDEKYPLEFVGGLPASYTCSHCRQFLEEPYQNGECGDRFCGDCVRLVANGAKKCPQCSARMTIDTTFADAAVRREIGALEVCCPFKRFDCGETLPYRNLKDHMEACSKKPVGASAGNGTSAAMSAVERRLEGLERTVQDVLLKLDGFSNQVSSLVSWKSNNTMSSGDNGAVRQMGEMARRLQTLEESAQRASLVHGAIPFGANSFETRMSALTDSVNDLFEKVARHEQTSHDGLLLWKIDNFRRKKKEAVDGVCEAIYSPPFYSHRFGYKMCARVYLNGNDTGEGDYLAVYFILMKGEYDATLDFPFALRVKFTLLHQASHSPNLKHRFTPSPRLSANYQRPTSALNPASGFPEFVRQSIVESPTYLKDDCIYLRIAVGNATSKKTPS